MKRTIVILILFLFCLSIHGQTKDDYDIGEPDDYLVIDSIKRNYPDEDFRLLVYQTGYGDKCMSSVVFIHTKNGTEYWCILYKSIEESKKCPYSVKIYKGRKIVNAIKINIDSIFSYKEYRKTGLLKKETYPKDPFEPSRLSNRIFYYDNTLSFNFEDNTDTGRGYTPDMQREKYRKEWVAIIHRELAPIFIYYCGNLKYDYFTRAFDYYFDRN